MSTPVSTKKESRWDQAIRDAQDTIAKCRRKIESMEAAIEAFKKDRDAGTPWPGTSTHN
jgi:hypothetical protein